MLEISDVLTLEEKLTRQLMVGWKRRGSSLLQIGLHSFLRPEFFWDAGFDVCATDENLQVIQNSFDISGPRIEYSLAKFETSANKEKEFETSLPFDDNSFDYAFFTCYASPEYFTLKNKQAVEIKSTALNSDLPNFLQFNTWDELFKENNIYKEACRVASKGLIILFKNKIQFRRNPALGKRINIYSFLYYLKKFGNSNNITFISGSITPKILKKTLSINNVLVPNSPFGDFMGVRINFDKTVLTGLGIGIKTEKSINEEVAIQRESETSLEYNINNENK